MDTGTGLTILGSALGSAKILEKMLGPTAMEFSPKEDANNILHHAMIGLAKEGLIENDFNIGTTEDIINNYRGNKERIKQFLNEEKGAGGIIFMPSLLGVELFHWAYGMGDKPIRDFLKPEVTFSSGIKIRTSPGFKGLWKEVDKEPSEPDTKSP